jgi:hypothetical protein
LGTVAAVPTLMLKNMMRSAVVANDTINDDIGNTGKRSFQRVHQSRKESSVTIQEAYKKT